MPILIALTGLSGSGKTTAIRHFEDLGLGVRVYLGQAVLDEVAARKLTASAANERQVRLDLRGAEGPTALAVRALPLVDDLLRRGTNVFVDAIFDSEEYLFIQNRCSGYRSILLAVEACFATRSTRLSTRPERSLTVDDLKDRDGTEIAELKINRAIGQANHRIENEGTIEAFRLELNQLWGKIRSSS
jgi:dephospho-CoA kinase